MAACSAAAFAAAFWRRFCFLRFTAGAAASTGGGGGGGDGADGWWFARVGVEGRDESEGEAPLGTVMNLEPSLLVYFEVLLRGDAGVGAAGVCLEAGIVRLTERRPTTPSRGLAVGGGIRGRGRGIGSSAPACRRDATCQPRAGERKRVRRCWRLAWRGCADVVGGGRGRREVGEGCMDVCRWCLALVWSERERLMEAPAAMCSGRPKLIGALPCAVARRTPAQPSPAQPWPLGGVGVRVIRRLRSAMTQWGSPTEGASVGWRMCLRRRWREGCPRRCAVPAGAYRAVIYQVYEILRRW